MEVFLCVHSTRSVQANLNNLLLGEKPDTPIVVLSLWLAVDQRIVVDRCIVVDQRLAVDQHLIQATVQIIDSVCTGASMVSSAAASQASVG